MHEPAVIRDSQEPNDLIKRTSGHRHARRECHVKAQTRREGGQGEKEGATGVMLTGQGRILARGPERDEPCKHFHVGLAAPKTMRINFCSLSHTACSTLSWQPQETKVEGILESGNRALS